jgi:hypothetical protein
VLRKIFKPNKDGETKDWGNAAVPLFMPFT